MNAKSLAWKSRVRRIDDGSSTEEKQEGKKYNKITLYGLQQSA